LGFILREMFPVVDNVLYFILRETFFDDNFPFVDGFFPLFGFFLYVVDGFFPLFGFFLYIRF